MQKKINNIIEIHIESEEQLDIILAANKLHNALKTYLKRLDELEKYDEDDRAAYERRILLRDIDNNGILNLF